MKIPEKSIRCVNGVPDDSKQPCKHAHVHMCMRIAERVNLRVAYLQHRVANRLMTTVAVLVEEPPAPHPASLFILYVSDPADRRPLST